MIEFTYYLKEGSTRTGHEFVDKSESLRMAYMIAQKRKSVVSVYHKSGKFIKSFDGRK